MLPARGAIAVLLALWTSVLAAVSPSEDFGVRSIPLSPASTGKTGFTLLNPQETGVVFTNVLRGDAYLTNAVAHNGSGVALGDVDQDGWPDIYFSNLEGPNELYRNLGNFRFERMDIGEAACAGQFSTGAAFADVDGDGDLDLLVNGIATGTRLFDNDGAGRWSEATASGLSRTASATSMALADIDRDGDLDLYCTHYIDVMHLADPTTRFALERRDGQWVVSKVNGESTRLPKWKDRFEALPSGKVRELPEVHGLYRNEGNGRFTAIEHQPGVYLDEQGKAIPPFRDWGLAVMFRDMNGDGAPDIYVCNDNASPDRIWINQGRGTFRVIDPLKIRHTSRSSMGVDFADLNRDGRDDFIVVDMLAREPSRRLMQLVKDLPERASIDPIDGRPEFNRNTLFFARSDGSFAEAALMAGVAATDWSWCPIFVDVDLDGYEDLLVTNGFEFDVMDQDSSNALRTRRLTFDQQKRSRQYHPRWRTPNASFRNRGDGTFEPMDDRWGFDQPGVSYGMALADLDRDGDLDVVVNNLNEAPGMFRNNSAAPRIAVRLKGRAPNTQGIGAKIRLTGGTVAQSQVMIAGGRYMSGDEAVRVFAADGQGLHRLEIRWPDGTESVLTNLQANRAYLVDQSAARSPAVAVKTDSPPFFADVSALLAHVHTEAPFDDWARQPLLPHRLSRLGPGVSWFDLDGDGWEDLTIGSGRGGKLAIVKNQDGKSFQRMETPVLANADHTSVVGWNDGQGNRRLLFGNSNLEAAPGSTSSVAVVSAAGSLVGALPAGMAAVGPLALGDVDKDGDLDLFVGGHFRPGAYPEPVSSAVWLNEKGQLQPSAGWSEPFQPLGMVSGATLADLDNDGDADLALAMQWGPIRILRNDGNRFPDATERFGLKDFTGCWTSIAAGDFDADGKLDLVAGNLGRNTPYELFGGATLRSYYGDWDGNGVTEVLEAWREGTNWFPVQDRSKLARGWPEVLNRFPTHVAYARATVSDILGAHGGKSKTVEAAHLESTVFMNRGTRFEAAPLPREAQLSPVFSVNVGDFNGDGREDLFLAQNFFGRVSEFSREDAGRGLWLAGNGRGSFEAVDASVSGIDIPGEQRGAALADFNRDGRVDLAVSQNSAETKLFLNQRATRGLRVRLKGPAANPDAIGAQMRVVYAGGALGPNRPVQAGSGYWSQDGAVQVLGIAEAARQLWIRWPNGREQTVDLKADVWEVFLEAPK